MLNPKLSHRYAKSVYDLAKETGKEEIILNDMKYISALCHASRDFQNFVKNPVISKSTKVSIFKTILGTQVSELTEKFVNLMVRKSREYFLPEVAHSYINFYNSNHNIKVVSIKSAQPLDEKSIENIVNKVKSQLDCDKVEVKTSLDENLIGGFVLEVDNKLFDASIRRDLNDIKKHFASNLYIHNIK